MLVQGIDHLGLHAGTLGDFEEMRRRLMEAGATDGTVTVFGRKLSLFFRDPDLMECELLVANPDADDNNLEFGIPSARFHG